MVYGLFEGLARHSFFVDQTMGSAETEAEAEMEAEAEAVEGQWVVGLVAEAVAEEEAEDLRKHRGLHRLHQNRYHHRAVLGERCYVFSRRVDFLTVDRSPSCGLPK